MSEPWIVGDIFLDHHALETEWLQCTDEGRDLSEVAGEFERLKKSDMFSEENRRAAGKLLDRTINLPIRDGYTYLEPSALEEIHKARPNSRIQPINPPVLDDRLRDKIHGAWLGRCCGCLLGKPIECWLSDRVWPMLEAADNWPLSRYMEGNLSPDIKKKYDIHPGCWGDQVDFMPEDDDLNYTVIGLQIMKSHGVNFTTNDIARFWFQTLPIEHTFTAERVAYRNLAMMIQPPGTATFRNPYREWIGAQIRADFYGYAAPGRPETAAAWAWRDASLTHVKNGIYGEMWVAAMLAAAAVLDDIEQVILIGLAEIPVNCRFAEAIQDVISLSHQRVGYDEAVARIHKRWDERKKHHWCHAISNAQIVAVGLLWGGKDLGTSICRAVQPCFDTDCNGATVGSIIGMIHGASKLPQTPWVAKLNDTLYTGIAGHHQVSIAAKAEETFELVQQFWGKA